MNRNKLWLFGFEYGALLFVLAALVGIFSLLSDRFLQLSTVMTIANSSPELIFIAVGMTLVLIVAGIDLSVGSVLALSSAVVGSLMCDFGWSFLAVIPLCLATGIGCGLFNGWVSVGFGIPSFIVTLGMLQIARGTAKVVTDSKTKYIGSAVESLGEPLYGIALSPAFLLAIAAVVIGQFVLVKTVFGRYCIAIGANETAAKLSGIRTARYTVIVFTISGFLSALAGLVQTSRFSSAVPNSAVGIELDAIAACVIGGTSLMGGRGSVVCSFIGVLIIAVLQTGLAQVGVPDANKQIVTGVVIIVAVVLDAVRSRWRIRNAA